ncbi:MAG: sulfatase-like hydrolase/transferase [archaeon]
MRLKGFALFSFLAVLLLAVAAAALLFLLPQTATPQPYPTCPGCNVIIIEFDCFNRDHAGYLGYFRNTTPNLDALAKRSAVFPEAFSSTQFTEPSDYSLFTGLHLSEHGRVGENFIRTAGINNSPSNRPLEFLPEKLNAAGYETAAFVGATLTYEELREVGFSSAYYGGCNKCFGKTVGKATDWLRERNREKPFFLFLQSYSLHDPYHGPGEDHFDPEYDGIVNNLSLSWSYTQFIPFESGGFRAVENFPYTDTKEFLVTSRDLENVVAKYDGILQRTDEELGIFLKNIEELGLAEKTVIIFLSEHGEVLDTETGVFGHGYVGRETFKVPLLIFVPKSPSRNLTGAVSTKDVFYAVQEILGTQEYPEENDLFLEENRGYAAADIIVLSNETLRRDPTALLLVKIFSGESSLDFAYSAREGWAGIIDDSQVNDGREIRGMLEFFKKEHPGTRIKGASPTDEAEPGWIGEVAERISPNDSTEVSWALHRMLVFLSG